MLSSADLLKIYDCDKAFFEFLRQNSWFVELLDEIFYDFFPAYRCPVCNFVVSSARTKNFEQTSNGPVCLRCFPFLCLFCNSPRIGDATVNGINACEPCKRTIEHDYKGVLTSLEDIKVSPHKHATSLDLLHLKLGDKCVAVSKQCILLTPCTDDADTPCPYCANTSWSACFRHSQCRAPRCDKFGHEPMLMCAEHHMHYYCHVTCAWQYSHLKTATAEATTTSLESHVKARRPKAKQLNSVQRRALFNSLKPYL